MFQGSIPALVTPMREDGSVDLEAWDRLLDFHDREGTDGVVVGGTTGESPTLERGELEALVRRAKARLGGRMPVIVGSGSASTAHSIALSKAAEAAGADGLLVVTPYYNKPTQEGLYRHFMAIADAVGIPVILYNVPGRTACDMLVGTVVRLSHHPRIVGVKEATGDVARSEAILRQARPGFIVLSGDDPTAAELIRIGARGVISVTANVAARAMHELCAAGLEGRHGEAVVGGDEHEQRLGLVLGPVVGHGFGDLDAGAPGHLDVEKHHVGQLRQRELGGVQAVFGNADDPKLGPHLLQQAAQGSRENGFVLGDDGGRGGGQGHGGPSRRIDVNDEG